ncbi:MAG: hypothetical protein PHY48_16185, partial [Candidatus Cloacimonetes bacterium]|nr:hypothetical protein [Candidatus Cloacimonadota bacterium]
DLIDKHTVTICVTKKSIASIAKFLLAQPSVLQAIISNRSSYHSAVLTRGSLLQKCLSIA